MTKRTKERISKIGAIEKVRKLIVEIDDILVERPDQIEALFAAMLAKQHILLLGPPGTAKSMLARLVCQSIENANYFEWLLSKLTVPEEVLGPFSLKAMEQDKFKRITTNKLPEAHIAFIDECWKCGSGLLNNFLSMLNEGIFHNDGVQKVPLLTCIGASNELPQGEELGALYDRFSLKFWIKPIQNDSAFCDLLEGNVGIGTPKTKLTLKEIDALRKEVREMHIDRKLLEEMREIHHLLEHEGVTASDRRWKAAVTTMKAYALIRGEKEVTNDELEVLADMMWENPEDRRKIQNIVIPRVNPLNLKAIKYLDQAEEIYNNWSRNHNPTDDTPALQANGSLKEIILKIEEDIKIAEESKIRKIKETRKIIQRYRKEIVNSMNVDDDDEDD